MPPQRDEAERENVLRTGPTARREAGLVGPTDAGSDAVNQDVVAAREGDGPLQVLRIRDFRFVALAAVFLVFGFEMRAIA